MEGGARSWNAQPGARGPRPQSGWDRPALAPSQSPARTWWEGRGQFLVDPCVSPAGPELQVRDRSAAASAGSPRSRRRDEAPESLPAGPTPGAGAAAGRGERRGAGRR